MKKALFILLLSSASLIGVSSCQEMFDENGQTNWEDFQTEIGTDTGTCTNTHPGFPGHGQGTETGTCSGTDTQTGYHHGFPGQPGQGQGTETGTCSGTDTQTGNHFGGHPGGHTGGQGQHGNN
ncbi:MAG: hypothetical protein WCR29_06040 [Bacteroidales bacterium]|nr:hypothetical protein [Bacteroidales bacterium]